MSCQLSGEGAARQSRLMENQFWRPSQFVLKSVPEGACAPLLPHLKQHHYDHSCKSCLPLSRDNMFSSGFSTLAPVPCNRSIFTKCPSSQMWFKYAGWTAHDFPSLFVLPYIWTCLWPSSPARATHYCQQNSEFKFASWKYLQGAQMSSEPQVPPLWRADTIEKLPIK